MADSSGAGNDELDPAYVAENNKGRILGVLTSVHFLALTFVAMRMYVRIRLVKSVGRDDWVMAACSVFALAAWCVVVLQGFHGLGHHIDTISDEDMKVYELGKFLLSIFYATVSMGLLKVSIALNLLRISASRWFSWPLWASVGFVSVYSMVGLLSWLLHCFPVEYNWDETIPGGHCYSVDLFLGFALTNTSCNIFTDVFFASMPVPIAWRLQMKRRTRLYLIGILSLGYLAVIIGVVKAVYQIAFTKNKDRTFDDWVQFWGFIQLNLGVIAACSPSLKPLVGRFLNLTGSSYARPYGSRRTNGSTLRTIGGGATRRSEFRSKTRDMYELRDLRDSDEAKRDDNGDDSNGDYAVTVARGDGSDSSAFYKGQNPNSDRSGSEEMILGTQGQQPDQNGIMMTREIVVK